jgi:hypothetical protein
MAFLVDIVIELGRSVLDLLSILQGDAHGILRGSHEAALVEAQGAQVGPDGFDHLDNLVQTGRALAAREDALKQTINKLGVVRMGVSERVREILQPLLNRSQELRATISQTEETATQLRASDGTRLQGVVFGQGGAGPEVTRDVRALVSTQMEQRAAELEERGIEPRIIPAARDGATRVMDAIRRLPLNPTECKERLVALLAVIRAGVTQAARPAAAVGRLALRAALVSLDAALVEMGSRLTTPIIFINLGPEIDLILGRSRPIA